MSEAADLSALLEAIAARLDAIETKLDGLTTQVSGNSAFLATVAGEVQAARQTLAALEEDTRP